MDTSRINELMQSGWALAVALGIRVLEAIALWIVGRRLIAFATKLIGKSMSRQHIDPTVIRYIQNAVAALLNIILVIAILGFFGVQTTSLAALIAAAGVAIGVAWSDKAPGKPSRIVAEISQNESNPDQHPSVTVGAPGGTVMVGGGAYDNYRGGAGNLLVQSYPADAETWSATGTDHVDPSRGTLTVYAIGVSNMQIES